MPQACSSVRLFLERASTPPGTNIKRVLTIVETKVRGNDVLKFRVKTKNGGLYTLTVEDREKGEKLHRAFKELEIIYKIGSKLVDKKPAGQPITRKINVSFKTKQLQVPAAQEAVPMEMNN